MRDIDRARATAWDICNKCTDKQNTDKLAALKVIIQCDVERFKLLTEGPAVMASKALAERVGQIEANITNGNGNNNNNG